MSARSSSPFHDPTLNKPLATAKPRFACGISRAQWFKLASSGRTPLPVRLGTRRRLARSPFFPPDLIDTRLVGCLKPTMSARLTRLAEGPGGPPKLWTYLKPSYFKPPPDEQYVINGDARAGVGATPRPLGRLPARASQPAFRRPLPGGDRRVPPVSLAAQQSSRERHDPRHDRSGHRQPQPRRPRDRRRRSQQGRGLRAGDEGCE